MQSYEKKSENQSSVGTPQQLPTNSYRKGINPSSLSLEEIELIKAKEIQKVVKEMFLQVEIGEANELLHSLLYTHLEQDNLTPLGITQPTFVTLRISRFLTDIYLIQNLEK